jgi:peptidyl-prolyl cis-trans isomerase C
VITAAELERRLAAVPPFQLRSIGDTPAEIRRGFLERVLVRELLLVQGAEAQRVADRPDVQEVVKRRLRGAVLAAERAEAVATPIGDDEVRAYYEANRAKFNAPPRVSIWRILVSTAQEAEAIIAEVAKDSSVKRWNELARERSLDKTTSMRGGNLGFVAPDGSTGEPGVKVDPAVVAAAGTVKDAELVPKPVPEGDRFAVVWRRQSMKAVTRTLEDEAISIRQILTHQRTETRVRELVERLRKEHLAEVHPELVDQLDVSNSGEIAPMRRPGTLPTSRRAIGSPAPAPGPGGLR